jgi:cytochrome oxidase assembly protein ShyY1
MNFLRASWRRYVAWLVLVCLFSAGCVLLSRWQLDRRTEVVSVIDTISNNYNQEPKPLRELLPSLLKPLPANKKWLPVSVTGHYLPEMTTLVRNRSLGGNPGFEVLVPFLSEDNQVVIINRGWVATGSVEDSPDFVPTPNQARLTLVGRLMPTEPALNRSAPAGQIPSIDLPALATMNSARTFINAYLLLDSESTKQPQVKHLPEPKFGEGNHLSYAIQWIIFGVLAFLTLIWAVRKEKHFYRLANDPNYVVKPKRKSETDKDADAEDALISGPELS